TRELDRGDLHAEAQPEIRHAPLPRPARRRDLALDAALAEPAGNDEAVHLAQELGGPALLHVLAFHPAQPNPGAVRGAGVHERLDDALVRVAHVGVLADDPDQA